MLDDRGLVPVVDPHDARVAGLLVELELGAEVRHRSHRRRDLVAAATRALAPLRRIGLRVGEISLMTMIAFSFIPLMADEVRRLQLAQAVRCGFPKRGPAAIRAAVPLLAPLVIGVFRRADEIDTALHVRCYRMDAPRSSFRGAGWRRADSLVCAAGAHHLFRGVVCARLS